MIWTIVQLLLLSIGLILIAAYMTYFERRIIGLMQLRMGPSVAGPFGILQPIADALKLASKEPIIPRRSSKLTFILAPSIVLILSLMGWIAIPIDHGTVMSDLNVGALYILALSSLSVYGILLAGFASKSQYAFLGSIRSVAQMISYELTIGMILLSIFALKGSLNLSLIVENKTTWLEQIMLLPLGIMFFICILAETNRHPFDLPEAESELVAGYNVEYSSTLFAMFFLGEYINVLMGSTMTVILFCGGYLPISGLEFLKLPGVIWLGIKVAFLVFCFVWIRASVPRYRFDQLMTLGWHLFLPLSTAYFIFLSSWVYFVD